MHARTCTLFSSLLPCSAFFQSVNKEIGDGGVGYAKLARLGIEDSKAPKASAEDREVSKGPDIYW